MGKAEYTVEQLVSKIEGGELQLPEMQRKYVWTSTKVRDLLDSLYREYPSGVILTWQPPGQVETRDFAVETGTPVTSTPLLLLDGQQRLTSLSAVIRGEPVMVKYRKRPVEILFNLDHPDELTFITEVAEDNDNIDDIEEADEADSDLVTRTNKRAFVVMSNQIAALPNWVKVTDVFTKSDSEILRNAGLTGWDDARYDTYSERLKQLRAIKDYSYRVDVLEPTKSYEEVTEIFVRVNSLGAKLRSSDLALAQITAKWNGSLKLFSDYQQDIAKRGFDLDLGVHLKTLIAMITGQSRFLTVASLTQERLEDGWKRAMRGMDFAVNFALQNARLDSDALLSSPFLMIATAYWGEQMNYTITDEEARAFRRWFLLANAKGRYSRGSTETLLDQDLAAMRGEDKIDALMQRLVQLVGRLDFTPDDLRGRSPRSGAFKTMFLAFRDDGAADWQTQLRISPKLAGKADRLEFHHIFPKAYMKRARPDVDGREVDDIANLAFISAKTNKAISAKSPAEYRGTYDPELLALQLVALADETDEADAFEDFLDERRQLIAAKLNEFLGV